MNTNGHHRTPMPNVAASVSELTRNVIELTELQSELLMLDLQKSSKNAKSTVILGVVAACLLLASVPVLLLAFGELLVEQLEWSRAASYFVAALFGLVASGIVGGIAYGYVKNGLVTLERSRHELRRNISWLKSTLKAQSSSPTADRPINY
jgi:putative superfamily III holin-X